MSGTRSSLVLSTTTPYRVVKVVDGDTIDLSIDGETRRVRLIGINSPESVDPRRAVECFGKEASSHAKEILTGGEVKVKSDPSQGLFDKYDRVLLYIYLSNGTLFNERMIEDGYAYEYTYNKPYKYQKVFKVAQMNAEKNMRGLWAKETCNGTK